MRNASIAPTAPDTKEIETLYGNFDLDLFGCPTEGWKSRNLRKWRSPEMFEYAFFPGCYLTKIVVNRRMIGPLDRVYAEICVRWNSESRVVHGLNQFVKCYCFGEGTVPNLFWYGAAWRLSNQLGGEELNEVVKVFTRHGFTWCGASDKRRIRDFELW